MNYKIILTQKYQNLQQCHEVQNKPYTKITEFTAHIKLIKMHATSSVKVLQIIFWIFFLFSPALSHKLFTLMKELMAKISQQIRYEAELMGLTSQPVTLLNKPFQDD